MKYKKNDEDIEDIDEDIRDNEYEVEKILKDRTIIIKNKNGKISRIKEYLIKWVGYDFPSWEPEENLKNYQFVLKKFLLNQDSKILNIKKNKNINNNKNNNNNKSKNNNINRNKNSVKLFGNNLCIDKKKLTKNINLLNQYNDCVNISLSETLSKKNNGNDLTNSNLELISISSEDNGEGKNEGKSVYYLDNSSDILDRTINKNKENGINKSNINSFYSLELSEDKSSRILNNNKNYHDTIITLTEKENDKSREKISRVSNNDESILNKIDQIEQTIYLGDEGNFVNSLCSNLCSKSNEEIIGKEINNKNFINKKRYIPNNGSDSNNDNINENKVKIMEILNMRVPKDYNKGIILTIKYKKFNKIYIEQLDSKIADIPINNLIQYYEMFICDAFRGQNYSKRLSFD